MSCSNQLDTRRVNGVVGGTAEQEEEEAALIRRVKWPCDQRMDLMTERVWKTVSGGLDRKNAQGDCESVDRS